MKILFLSLLVLGSCSFKKDNQKKKGHEELYSEPEAPKLSSLSKEEKRIVIASTNDRHANSATSISFEDDHNNKDLSIQIGGTSTSLQYFKILRETYKNVVLVDSGDIFPNKMDIGPVKEFYTAADYDAYTVGLRDFNLKVPQGQTNAKVFEQLATTSNVPLLLSNLYELKTARVVEWKGSKPYVLKDFDGIRVGIIGVIPDDVVAQTPVNNRVGLFVENMIQSTLRNSRLLRSLGADIIVVLTHQSIDCNTSLAEKKSLRLDKVNFDPTKQDVCDLNNPLGEYLNKLPPDLVDVVVGGRSTTKTANVVNGIVVMNGFPDGKSFNFTELVVNIRTKRVVPEKTVVHQPVLFCSEFFKETSDCYTSDPSVNHKERVPATFFGTPIQVNGMAKVPAKKLQVSNDVPRALLQFKADLSFTPVSSGETQLLVMNLTGRELLKVLEEDYNQGRKNLWSPSPYLLKNDELSISISGLDLELDKTYRVLADLESFQKHRSLRNFITRYESEAHLTSSWTSVNEDALTSKMSAQVR